MVHLFANSNPCNLSKKIWGPGSDYFNSKNNKPTYNPTSDPADWNTPQGQELIYQHWQDMVLNDIFSQLDLLRPQQQWSTNRLDPWSQENRSSITQNLAKIDKLTCNLASWADKSENLLVNFKDAVSMRISTTNQHLSSLTQSIKEPICSPLYNTQSSL